MYKFELKHYMLHCKEKKFVFAVGTRKLNLQITKRLCPRMENPRSVTVKFADDTQI